jgi:formiminotetrahydrofolate cyclodeaminase
MVTSMADMTVREFVTTVGEKTPTPGGGAVAAIAAALAAALARMTVAFSVGKKSLAHAAEQHQEWLVEMRRLADESLSLADEDARAYTRLNALWKLSADDPQRQRDWLAAVAGAIEAPKQIMQACLDMIDQMRRMVGTTNPQLRSDLAIAAILAHAAADAARWNVLVNLPLLDDREKSRTIQEEIDQLLRRIDLHRREIVELCERQEP